MMRRALGVLLVPAVVLGLAVIGLRRVGLLGPGECGPYCACSLGEGTCTCGHVTCLNPAG